MSDFFIEPLNTDYHDILSFQCGKSTLDALLHDPVHLKECGNTYVVVSSLNSRHILACFTLLPDLQDILAEDGEAVEFTAILLNILAVDSRHQRQGHGKRIVAHILRNMLQASQTHQLDYLLVEPLDDEAKHYYLHLNVGFVSLDDGKLVLSVETMRRAMG